MRLFNVNRDDVIKSSVSLGETNYQFALENLYPLLNRFQDQRKLQNRKFYDRLRKDILRGCIMPPITLAFVDVDFSSISNLKEINSYVIKNINQGYILDGMQRLNTLKDASELDGFDSSRALQVNVIIAENYDLLLYRMITLNNGQRPMTARHQIEMLTKGLLDTNRLSIQVITEKETEINRPQGAFKQSDISEAYTAYLSNNLNNQNKRIIEEKLNEILVGRVMESNVVDSDVSFYEILEIVDRFSSNPVSRDWLRLGNNLIGFCVGAKVSHKFLLKMDTDDFATCVQNFEEAFGIINVSKVNVGKLRRELSKLFIGRIDQYFDHSVDDLNEYFHEATVLD